MTFIPPLPNASVPDGTQAVTIRFVARDAFIAGTQRTGFKIAGLFPYDVTVRTRIRGKFTYALTSSDPSAVQISPIAGTKRTFKLVPRKGGSVVLTATAMPATGKKLTGKAKLQIVSLLYVANSVGSGATPSGTVTAYVPWRTTPVETISAGINQPEVLTVDLAGNLWVGNDHGGTTGLATITKYAPGGLTPMRTISGVTQPSTAGGEALAVDVNGNLFCVCNKNTGSSATEVDEYTPGSTTPSRALTSTNSAKGINSPYSVAVDGKGNLYVGNCDNSAGISVYAPGSSTTPVRNITAGVNCPWLIDVDPHGNVYAGNYFASPSTVTEYKAGGSVPFHTFGSSSGIASVDAIAVDAVGNVYATSSFSNPDKAAEFSQASPPSPSRSFPSIYYHAYAIATDALGRVYIPSADDSKVYVYARGTSTTPLYALTTADGIAKPFYVAAWP